MRRVPLLAVLLLAAILPTAAAGDGPVDLRSCGPFGGDRCGTFTTDESPAGPTGRRLALKVVVLPAAEPGGREPKALFVLAGGPGGAATEMVDFARARFYDYNQTHDIVLVDQRGTGGTAASCPFPGLISTSSPSEQVRRYWSACLAESDVDARLYTTAVAMADLDAVRAALGYERIDLYGVSYGATAAQVYLLLHGDRVRTLMLDGATLLDVPIFERWPANAQRTLDRLFARCTRTPACRKAFPSPAADLQAVLARLARKPLRIGKATIGDEEAAWGIQLLSRTPATAARIPLLLRFAAKGRLAPLVDEIGRVAAPGPPNTLLMFWSIVCSEPWARADPAAAARWARGTYLETYWNRETVFMQAVCSAMPRGVVPQGSEARVRSTVPTLLFTGLEDPQDPPAHVAGVTEAMPNAKVVLVRGAGHPAFPAGCTPQLAERLLRTGTTAGIDVSCALRAPLTPFALG